MTPHRVSSGFSANRLTVIRSGPKHLTFIKAGQVPPGSRVVYVDNDPGAAGRAASYQTAAAPLVLRPFDRVSAFFDGFELVEPR